MQQTNAMARNAQGAARCGSRDLCWSLEYSGSLVSR